MSTIHWSGRFVTATLRDLGAAYERIDLLREQSVSPENSELMLQACDDAGRANGYQLMTIVGVGTYNVHAAYMKLPEASS
jgi:hypothetical protein